MKIFEIVYNDGNQQWVVASTNIEALQEVLSIESTDLDMMKEIKEFPEENWDATLTANSDADKSDPDYKETTTFREAMIRVCSATILASTFYES